ncbi:hypothetical protein [Lacticaseibacillus hulanensis]|uniref:hypothetical protein n=1 Tax=Lacticaseibacillus hulanensis TaxID=2493111 RepID=UPI000FDB05C7|nr:hypothetical protein [Lacticaseibacillus hulanensis]
MTKQKLVTLINQRVQLLTKDNATYYSKILIYTRMRSFFKDGDQVERELLSILNDMIDAQGDGVSALEYFGPHPGKVTQDILAAIPNDRKAITRLVLACVAFYCTVSFVPLLLFPDEQVDLGTFVLMGIPLALLILIFFWMFSTSVFSRHPVLYLYASFVLLGVGTGGLIVANMFIHTPLRVRLAGTSGVIVIVLLLLLATYAYYRNGDHVLNLGFYLFPLLLGIFGIVLRLSPSQAHYWLRGEYPPVAWVMVGVLALIWFYPLSVLLIRLRRNRHKQVK